MEEEVAVVVLEVGRGVEEVVGRDGVVEKEESGIVADID